MSRPSQSRQRDGVATTECAFALPLIIVFTLFTIDICSVIFLKETVTIAAYEGARVGIQRGGTDASVKFRVQEFLDARGITYNENNVVTHGNTSFDDADEMEHVLTQVRVPANGNLPFGWFFTSNRVLARVQMRKEFPNPGN